VWAVCNASEHCSSNQITIKSPQNARLEGVPYSSGRPAPDGMWSGFKCKVGWKVQQWGMTTRGWRIDRYNVPASWASSHLSQCWNHISMSHVPPAGHNARCTGATRGSCMAAAAPRLVKTASSGSFGFQGPGSHLIGLVQQFRLSIGGCGGRQWGWKRTHLLLPRPQFFLRKWMWANQRMTPTEQARCP